MTGLYIHIPFCRKKCNYCDFVSFAGRESEIDNYVDQIVAKLLNSSLVIRHSSLSTIFFGGGTPTLLAPKHFEHILKNVGTTFMVVRDGPEITTEANPGTADLAKLKALRQLGINRLSIGVQSFNDRHLQVLGRIHNGKSAKRFYHDARVAGFTNINLDLIYGLPNQTLAEWQNDLQTAISLKPDHLACYNLQIEEGTPLHEELQNSNLKLPNNETELKMYRLTIKTLTAAGYKHYEIANFAKPGFECQHNLNYWRNGRFIGIGTGAKSQLEPDPCNTIFLGLRLINGLSVENFVGYEKEVDELIKTKMLTRSKGNYKLTRKGLYLGNEVFVRFV
jgi:oxygen-independent coproporphyrinogen-3 oxidase